jgi:tetratricopeptide (TPR) repeat protein
VCQGKYKDAQISAIKAATMEPKSAAVLFDAGWAFFAAGAWDQAADHFRKSIEADPAAPAGYVYYGMTQLKQTKKPEGFASLEKGFDASGQAVWAAARLGAARAVAENPKDGEEALVQVSRLGAGKFASLYDLAMIYAAMGEKETAFTWLDQALVERSPRLMDLRFDPFFYRLHSDTRFKAILKKLNLPELPGP